MPELTIDSATAADVPALASILVDSVAGGASVGFVHGFAQQQAEQWWHEHLERPGAVVLVAHRDAAVVGTVTLLPVPYANGQHRAEVAKLVVAPRARGRGTARALLAAVEQVAREHGRWLLLLDTEQGSPAQRLYESDGWQVFGVLPDHATRPDGTLHTTAYLTKRL